MPESLSLTMIAPQPAGEMTARALRSDVIYAKTARGHEEVSMRAYGLTPKQRRVLIMMNGKKDLAAIAGFIPLQELNDAVPYLLAERFISEMAEQSDAAARADVISRLAAGRSEDQVAEHQEALAPIKQMMIAAATLHLGLLASDIIRRIDIAGDPASLQSVAGYWHVAILESKTGSAKAGMYLEEVRRAMAAL